MIPSFFVVSKSEIVLPDPDARIFRYIPWGEGLKAVGESENYPDKWVLQGSKAIVVNPEGLPNTKHPLDAIQRLWKRYFWRQPTHCLPLLVVLECWKAGELLPESRFGLRVVGKKDLLFQYEFVDPAMSVVEFGELLDYIPESAPSDYLLAKIEEVCREIPVLATTDINQASNKQMELLDLIWELRNRREGS